MAHSANRETHEVHESHGGQFGSQSVDKLWSAEEVADQLESLAKTRLDTKNTFTNELTPAGERASLNLAEKWADLNQGQRDKVAACLTDKYDHFNFDALPRPEIIKNASGEVTGIEFKASGMDFNFGPGKVRVDQADPEKPLVYAGRQHRWFSFNDKPIIDQVSGIYKNLKATD